jgi:biotin-(acetyl-CoA carboxylase) ligase
MRVTPPLFYLEEVESTNTFLRKWGESGTLESGTSLYAERQTRGRGRPGNVWIQNSGNLALSLWIGADHAGDETIAWTLKMAYCLLEELSEHKLDCALKYPNDLWKREPPGKIGGILVERSRKGWTIGVGLNRYAPDVPQAAGWESLPEMHRLARAVSGRFYRIFLDRNVKPVSSRMILERLNQNLLWKGLWVSWKSRGKPEVGKIQALGASGRLEVLLPSGVSIEIPETVRTLEPMDRKSEP